MTQRVTDEQLVRWTRSNDSALNDVSADCQDARAEIATLRAKLAAVCEAVEEFLFTECVDGVDAPQLRAALAAAREGKE